MFGDGSVFPHSLNGAQRAMADACSLRQLLQEKAPLPEGRPGTMFSATRTCALTTGDAHPMLETLKPSHRPGADLAPCSW